MPHRSLDASPNAWDWALMVVASLVGGLHLGIAFMGFADQAGLPDARRQSTEVSRRAVAGELTGPGTIEFVAPHHDAPGFRGGPGAGGAQHGA